MTCDAIAPNRLLSCRGPMTLRHAESLVRPTMTSSPVRGADAMKISHRNREPMVLPDRIAPS
jgi:hypothetical protein